VLFFEKHGLYEEVENDKFMNLIKIWFASNRKKLYKNLLGWWLNKQKVEDAFCSLHIDKNIRGEDIDIKNWCLLIAKL
jgi:16S rRNA A1518/A1519 N6-dimethyltransferase RsmA/KsgA/DIM1 with predicted DNA glycosylase/AP lyase activity